MKALTRLALFVSALALPLLVTGEQARASGIESKVWYVPVTPKVADDPGGLEYPNSLLITDLSGEGAKVTYWVGDKKFGPNFGWKGEAVVVVSDKPIIVTRDFYRDQRFGRLTKDEFRIFKSTEGHPEFGFFTIGRILERVTELAYPIDCSGAGKAHVACKRAAVTQPPTNDSLDAVKGAETVAPPTPDVPPTRGTAPATGANGKARAKAPKAAAGN